MPAFPFSIELDNGHGKVVLGTVANPSLAWATYYAALRAYPDDVIVLRERGTTVAQSRHDDAMAAAVPPAPRSRAPE